MFSRIAAPLFLASALALLAFGQGGGAPARVERVRIDPGRDPASSLEALEGLSGATARRIVLSRRDGAGIRSAADLAAVPGVGTRRIHRWHGDLAFAEDLR
jgi:Helix-hairpin-helix motif